MFCSIDSEAEDFGSRPRLFMWISSFCLVVDFSWIACFDFSQSYFKLPVVTEWCFS